MKKYLALMLFMQPAALVSAASLSVQIELPVLNVAEYHAPYVAVWLQNSETRNVTNLALWYDTDKKNDKGQQWLKDLRQWWRRSGRSLNLPADGFSGATRTAGHHTLNFSTNHPLIAGLPDGEYELNIEAVREVGGRELLTTRFSLPLTQAETLQLKGQSELGTVVVALVP